MSQGFTQNTVTNEEADTFTEFLARLVRDDDKGAIANLAVAVLAALSASLHMRNPGACAANGGCVHGQQFGHELSMAFATGKAAHVLSSMELANTALAAGMALAILQPDESDYTTPRAILEDLANTFENIDEDEDGWEQHRRVTRDTLELDAMLLQLESIPTAAESDIEF